MLPGINPKMLKQAMKQMGIKQDELEAKQVIIKLNDTNLIINNPSVLRINMQGQESFQISGDVTEQKSLEEYSEEDVSLVVEQTDCTQEQAIKALKDSKGDIAQAILSLK